MNAKLKLPIFFMLFLNCLSALFAFEPSGGVLVLDGIDDYAILPFEDHGFLIPKGFREYTVEAWVYPEAQAKSGDQEVILSQQVGFESWPQNPCFFPWFSFEEGEDNVHVVLSAYLHAPAGDAIADFPVTLKKNQWSYLALILNDGKVGAACNQIIRGKFTRGWDIAIENMNSIARPEDFVVGGYDRILEEWKGLKFPCKVTYFQGYIDAIRFSDVARCDFPADGQEHPFIPPHRFEADKNTLALWNFDDGEGATVFSDDSGNGHNLIGKNGAHVHGWLSVNPLSSIATTWGEIRAR